MTRKQIQAAMASDKEFRQKLLDDEYFLRLQQVLRAEDPVEAREGAKIRRKLKEERKNLLWWLDIMRSKAQREANKAL